MKQTKKLSGVKFELKKENSNEKYVKETDENGEIIFDRLYQGKYILKEIETNQEYIMNNNSFDINIQYNKQAEIIVENDMLKGSLKIHKVDSETNEPIKRCKF